MDGADLAALRSLPGAFVEGTVVAGAELALDDETAHHLRVRRLQPGAVLRLTDGAGTLARATLLELEKRRATARVDDLTAVPPPLPIRLLVPIADRDRMLWLAEKTTELGLREWAPVTWSRSRSVSPRGTGEVFRDRTRARMVSALLQSGGAWLPRLAEEREPAELAARPAGELRLLLDPAGPPLLAGLDGWAPVAHEIRTTVALGPEGGLTGEESGLLNDLGFVPVSLGAGILRFETAAVAALAILGAARDTWRIRAVLTPGLGEQAG